MKKIIFLSFVVLLSIGSSACAMHRILTRFQPHISFKKAGWNAINTANVLASGAGLVAYSVLTLRLNKLIEHSMKERLEHFQNDALSVKNKTLKKGDSVYD
jgi:hypothetical protein